MKNPNSMFNKLKRHFNKRWSEQEYPGGPLRFEPKRLAADIGVYILLPALTVFTYKSLEATKLGKRPTRAVRDNAQDSARLGGAKSQIIEFATNSKGSASGRGFSRRSPGTLVKVRLLNVVETYSTAPVHAQIIDRGLGDSLLGGTLIGDATPDSNFERINIMFRYVRDPSREGVAASINARALGLDGTLGLSTHKKEGFMARSVANAASNLSGDQNSQSGDNDVKQILIRALTAGLMQEYGSKTQVEKNRAQVLTLTPPTEFYVELTDFFPSGGGR